MAEGNSTRRALPRLPNVARLEVAAIVEIYSLLSESDELRVPADDLITKLNLGVGAALVMRALSQASSLNGRFFIDDEGSAYLSEYGFDFIQEMQDDPSSDIEKYLERGADWVLEASRPIAASLDANLENATLESTVSTAKPQASTAPQAFTTGAFGESPFGSGPFGGDITSAQIAPAADRYVSVKDNQSDFDKISEALTTIKNEFAQDHYKQANLLNTPAIVGEIEAFERQIESTWVSRPAAQSFLETLKYIETVCVSSSKIAVAIATIVASLTAIFGLM